MTEYPEWLPDSLKMQIALPKEPDAGFAYHSVFIGRGASKSLHVLSAKHVQGLLTHYEMEVGWGKLEELGFIPLEFYWFLETEIESLELFKTSKKLTDSAWEKHQNVIHSTAKKLAALIENTPFDMFPLMEGRVSFLAHPIQLSDLLSKISQASPSDLVPFSDDYRPNVGSPGGKGLTMKQLVLTLARLFHSVSGDPQRPLVKIVMRAVYGTTSVDSKQIDNYIQNDKRPD